MGDPVEVESVGELEAGYSPSSGWRPESRAR